MKKNKLFILLIWLLFHTFVVFFALRIEFDNSKWLPDTNIHQKNKDYLYEEFDKGENLIIAIDINKRFFDQDIIDSLRSLTKQIQDIDNIVEVTNPLESTTIIQKNNELHIITFGDALKDGLIKNLKSYQDRFTNSEYFGRLLSHDYTVFAIVLKIDVPSTENKFITRQSVLESTKRLLAQYPQFSSYQFAGEIELNYQLDQNSREDLVLLLPIAGLLIVILLYIIFRSFWKTSLILLTAVSSLLATLAVSSIQGHAFTVVSMSLPILILGIAIADAIHVMARWEKLGNEIPDQLARLKRTISETWLPCLVTTMTTSVGFGSFFLSEIIPLYNFGIDSEISIAVAYAIIMLTMWAGLYIFGNKMSIDRQLISKNNIVNVFLQHCYRLSSQYSGRLVLLTILLSGLSISSLFSAYTETNFLDVFLKKTSGTYQAFEHVDNHLGGTGAIDIIFKGTEEGVFKKIQSLESIVNIETLMKKHELVQYVQSYLNPIRLIHKEFKKEKSELPTTENKLAQEILFLEFSRGADKNDVLSPYVDFTYENSRMHLQTPNLNSTLAKKMKTFINDNLRETDLEYIITGNSIFFEVLSSYVINTQLFSIGLTILFIWILFIFHFGFRLGSISMIPNLLPVLFITGLIAFLNIPFDFATVLIASISFGLCVDDCIHFVHYYKLKTGQNLPLQQSMQETILALGRPLIYTTVLLCIGFGVLMLSDMVVLVKFGLFTFAALFLALLSNVMILPSFLKVIYGRAE